MSPRTDLRPLSGASGHLYSTWLWWPVGSTLVGPTGLQQRDKELLKSYDPQDTVRATDPDLSVKEAWNS